MIKQGINKDLSAVSGTLISEDLDHMVPMARAITEAIILESGSDEFIKRISDPNWFQTLGSVLGMDWHSSGITTSVMAALKLAINPISDSLGLFICGGRGSYSQRIPFELNEYSIHKGLDADNLVRNSKLSAIIDNTAIQDGYQLYLHSFIVSESGKWSVVQQGMNGPAGIARRYHWYSESMHNMVDDPHSCIVGNNMGNIINLTDKQAAKTRQGIIELTYENPQKMIDEIRLMVLPVHHDVSFRNLNLKKLGSVLAIANERQIQNFEELLLLDCVGPKTLRSLTLVSEVVNGTQSVFKDPAIPYPKPGSAYDETYQYLRKTIDRAKLGLNERKRAVRGLVSNPGLTNIQNFPKPKKKRTESTDKQLNLFS